MKITELKPKLDEIAVVIVSTLKEKKERTGKLPKSYGEFGVWFVENMETKYRGDVAEIEAKIGEDALREWIRDTLADSGLYKRVGEDELEVAS
jgi:hypothetical protein